MSESFYETWQSRVERTAKYVSKDFPDVEAEDLIQEMYEFVWRRGWTNPDDESITIILKRVGMTKAMELRTQHLTVSPQYSYRPSEVRAILENVFDHEDWPRRSVPTFKGKDGDEVPQWELLDQSAEVTSGFYNRLPKTQAEDGEVSLQGGVSRPAIDWDDKIIGYSDVKFAWKYLTDNEKQALLKRYGLKWETERRSAEAKRVERAVDRLVFILNNFRGVR